MNPDHRTTVRTRGLDVFARLMAEARTRGLSLRDVAHATGIRLMTLSAWQRRVESGKGPAYGELDLIARRALGTDLGEFLENSDIRHLPP